MSSLFKGFSRQGLVDSVTGLGSDRVHERVAHGVVELLRKPVSFDALVGAVRRCAARSFGL